MTTLIALVYRNSTAERSAIRPARAPRSTISHPPTARLPDTPERHRRPERLLAERHPRPHPKWRPVEHLQKRQHVARAGKTLEHNRDDNPPRFMCDTVVATPFSPGTANSNPTINAPPPESA